LFGHSLAKLLRMCYGELTPCGVLNSSVLRWLQKQDDDEDESSKLKWSYV